MTNRTFFPIALGLLLILVCANPSRAGLLDSVLDFGNVDVEASKLIRESGVVPITAAQLRLVLGLTPDGKQDRLRFPTSAEDRETPVKLLVVFKKPVPVGSLFWGGTFTSAFLLKGDAPADAGKMESWQAVENPGAQSGGSIVALPPGTTTRGILLTADKGGWETHLNTLRITASRLTNVVPLAQPYADSEYVLTGPFGPPFTYYAERVTKGIGEWINTGKNGKGNIPRPPVSDIDPSWFLLSWREKQTISGVWISDNFVQVELQYYAGPDDINPRAGVDKEWRKIRNSTTTVFGGRVVLFDPIETRGIRINILKTQEAAIARINGLHAYVDLKNAPAPKAIVAGEKSVPPIKLPYAYDFDGLGTMVIDDEKGVRVRNVFAREVVKKGDSFAPWDLKDDAGRTVPVGKYSWKMLAHPPLKLEYVTTVYPNVLMNSPENAPWHVGMNGSGGWMADHTPPRGGASAGDFVFLSSPVPESGVGFHVSDLTGKKLWAISSFAGFTGAWDLTADLTHCYALARFDGPDADTIYKVDLASHGFTKLVTLASNNNRKRDLKGVTNYGPNLYLSVNASEDWFTTAATTADVDILSCYPKYPPLRPARMAMERVPDPRSDFMGLFRLGRQIPGYIHPETIAQLETTKGKAARRHIVLAFNRPVAIGSAIFPAPEDKNLSVRVAALRPNEPLPANPGDNDLWIPFDTNGGSGFDVATAPKDTVTTAIRVSVLRGEDDPFMQGDEKSEYETDLGSSTGLSTEGQAEDIGLEGTAWQAKLEGMKFVSRRFENVATKAKVLVNSGKPNADRSWVAERKAPLTDEDPAIYALAWDEAQTLKGIGFQEIDGKRTEIDVWIGEGAPDIHKNEGWKHLKTYLQAQRYYAWETSNTDARYLDGYVNFDEEVKTKAVRLRICEQWLDLGERSLHGPRGDIRSTKPVDPLRARVLGIAAMKYIGGESSMGTDPLQFQRIEVVSKETGKVEKEVPIVRPGPIVADASGQLFTLSDKNLVKVNLSTGKHETLVAGDLKDPWSMAVDSKGNFYIYDNAPDRRNVRVYDNSGKFVRQIGETGGYQAGPWNPNRMQEVTALAVDKTDQLWVVSQTYWPKRVALFSTDGTWKRDFLGNTPYGGGGVLDPGDKRRLFFNNLEFEIDWETGKSNLKNLTWVGDGAAGEVPIYIDGRCYMVTRGSYNDPAQAVGIVYLYEKDRLRRVAAMGGAAGFEPLKSAAVQRSLGGAPLLGQSFTWSDTNFNEVVDFDEVTFFPTPANSPGTGQFDNQLGNTCSPLRWEVVKYLDTGVPVYQHRVIEALKSAPGVAWMKIDSGPGYFVQGNISNSGIINEKGEWTWKYYTEQYTTHGYAAAKPYWPGQLVAQFYMAGHFTAHAGDLGEAMAFHTNMGSMDLITTDGMVASWIFNDQRLPGKRGWSMQEHDRGMDMSDVTIFQEHFSSYLTRTSDNKYYAVVGHNHTSIVEVLGLDRFKRLSGSIDVTPEAVIKTQEWEQNHQKEVNYVRAPVIDIYRSKAKKKLDANLDDWDIGSASLGGDDNDAGRAVFRASYDDKYLYVAWETTNLGPLLNTGEQWDRLFKTGGAVDLQIGVDGTADPKRRAPVKGDKRVLITQVKGRAVAVLYDAVVPGTPDDKKWEAVSPIWRVSFDLVRKMDEALVAINPNSGRGYVVEAAIPLEAIGFVPKDGDRIKLDWGLLETDQSGNSVMRRTYWSNKATGIVADVPSEATLVPELWGVALIHDGGRRDFAEMTTSDDKIKEGDDKDDMSKMLKEFNSELEEDLKE